ncbi:MAG: ATP-binding protein [Gammaproteobacteria bacterium]|nr:ATP-binding protein [Gammaproteobacteria bacterium]
MITLSDTRFRLLLPLLAGALLIWFSVRLLWPTFFVHYLKQIHIDLEQQMISERIGEFIADQAVESFDTDTFFSRHPLRHSWLSFQIFDQNGQPITPVLSQEHGVAEETVLLNVAYPEEENALYRARVRLSLDDASLNAYLLTEDAQFLFLGFLLFLLLPVYLAQRGLINRSNIRTKIIQREDEERLGSLMEELNQIRQEEQQRHTENVEYQKAIMEHVVDGIITIDSKGIILSFNHAAETIFGYARDQVIGKSVNILIGNQLEMMSHEKYLDDYMNKKKKAGIIGIGRDVFAKRKNGEIFPMDLAVNRVDTKAGTVFVGIVRDISERKRLEDNIIKAQQSAELASEYKTRLMTNVSHEIRTPLNGILGMLDLLQHSRLDDEQQQFISAANESGHSLLKLVNDLLDFSQLESGKIKMEFVPFNLNQLANDVRDLFLSKALAKGLNFEVHHNLHKDCIVISDPIRLRQVLSNIIGNAVKFTPQGKIETRFSLIPSPEGPDTPHFDADIHLENEQAAMLHIEVNDTGIGIDEAKVRQIFEPFTQADNSITRNYGGTGLGLSISKEIIDSLGGDIRVESLPNQGSSFSILIPTLTGAISAPSTNISPPTRPTGVMIFGGTQNVYRTILPTLKALSIRYDVSASLDECLQLLSRSQENGHPFDVLLLELTAESRQIISDIRRHSATSALKIIGIKTGHDSNMDWEVDILLPNKTNNAGFINAINAINRVGIGSN